MIEVNCVLWGNKYTEDYVHILKKSIERNTNVEHKFVCYSDRIIQNIETRLLPKGLEGWWNKMYLFDNTHREEKNNIIFFDLDTVITGNIDWFMSYTGKFAILDKGIVDGGNATNYFATGLYAFNSSKNQYLWDIFKNNLHVTNQIAGDQDFATYCIDRNEIDIIQKMKPNGVRSYKLQGIYDFLDKPPDDLSIILFHGVPRPHQAISEVVEAHGKIYEPREWVKEYWHND